MDGTYVKLGPKEGTPVARRRCPDYLAKGGIWELNLDLGAFRIFHPATDGRSLGSFTLSVVLFLGIFVLAMPRFDFDPRRYPDKPGCYLMKDASGQVLYVGKAKNLRRRLASHFGRRKKGLVKSRTRRLIARVTEVEIIIVNNEVESLILENHLIQQHTLPFNRLLKKWNTGYPYIAFTDEGFPRFVPYKIGRVNKELEGAKAAAIKRRFGPYVNTRFRDSLLEYVTDAFGIRTCSPIPARACLRYHIGRCSGICEQKISAEEYATAVDQAVTFLSQRHADLIHQMKSEMTVHAERLEFERAQRIKNQVEALETTLEKQIVERDVAHDQDVIYFGDRKALVARVVRGTILGLDLFDLDPTRDHAEACEHFLLTRYIQNSPGELIVSQLRNQEQLEERLTDTNRYSVKITLPENGVELELLRLCKRNYTHRVPSKGKSCENLRPISGVVVIPHEGTLNHKTG